MTKPKPPAPTDMLSMRDAAAYIGVAYDTLAAWRRTGAVKIPCYKHGETHNAPVTYRRGDLDAYLASIRQEA